jgi:hypothetical protein
MLSDHYAYAIEDLHRNGSRPADTEWRAARFAQADQPSRQPGLATREDPHQRKKITGWFAARRQRDQTQQQPRLAVLNRLLRT